MDGRTRTLTMNWDRITDDEHFFESLDRISSAVPQDLDHSSEEDENYDDSRMSFASALSSASFKNNISPGGYAHSLPPMLENYDIWMAEPGSITERRKRLLQGMGLTSNKDLLKIASAKMARAVTKKVDEIHISTPPSDHNIDASSDAANESKPEDFPSSRPILLVRSRSDGDIVTLSLNTKRRKEELIGSTSKQQLTRTSSMLATRQIGICQYANSEKISPTKSNQKAVVPTSGPLPCKTNQKAVVPFSGPLPMADGALASFFLIKNLDTGNEFIVKEYNEQGMWNKLSDLQTGKQLTMEEFEKSVGYSPVVKELMRRANVSANSDDDRKISASDYLSKSFRNSKRRGVALLKNIKEVANTMSTLIADKERDNLQHVDQRAAKNSSQWVKVRQQGKSYKEFTALQLCQEIQAHEGSIWTIRFSLDARYLASAGEDRVVHIWEVQECEVTPMKPPDDVNPSSASSAQPMPCNATPVHPTAAVHPMSADKPTLSEITPILSERRRRGRLLNRKKGSTIPDYARVPDTVFALSEKPVCTLKGHLDDVLDLTWSKSSRLLLSSSMDKTVRLWDMETKSCLKLFAHNDYVTCISFNPVDDNYFISGSLDAKVRIWSIPDRQVVDWSDLHEMVTAGSYTPDGQGAIIGSHKGSCRVYNIEDCKLEQKDYVEMRKKKKSNSRKITGFQFCPQNPSEVLITSADSRIRIYDGSHIFHKFTGFRNTSSQISASFSPDGKYIISASEDSHVYIWKREEPRNSGASRSKSLITTHSHEYFQCRDVSVAIPWPGSSKNEPPVVEIHSKRHSKHSIPTSQSALGSPTKDDNMVAAHSKRLLPPLPKKHNALERSTSCTDELLAEPSCTDSGIGPSESFTTASGSCRYGDLPSICASGASPSQSWSSGRSLFDHGARTVQATAWGLVIVTAGLGGEIKVYQNFGLPVKVSRQSNLFRDLT